MTLVRRSSLMVVEPGAFSASLTRASRCSGFTLASGIQHAEIGPCRDCFLSRSVARYMADVSVNMVFFRLPGRGDLLSMSLIIP